MTVKSTQHLQRRVHAHDVLPLSGATVPGSGVIYSHACKFLEQANCSMYFYFKLTEGILKI
jgi:hypothetical protein